MASTNQRTPSRGVSGVVKPLTNRSKQVFPFITLALIVFASATQTEVAHTLTSKVGYNQPYFTFFLTHITFSFIFPLHLFFLRISSSIPISSHIDTLRSVIAGQLSHHPSTPWKRLLPGWSGKISWLTILISLPALSWFVAMLYSPAIDITAIYATSAFWAYFFSMILLKQPLSRVTVGSIGLAFAGVVVLSLDGMGEGEGGEEKGEGADRGRAFGDLVMMFGAILLGLYEVVYKMILPEDHGSSDSISAHTNGSMYTAISQTGDDAEEETNDPLSLIPPLVNPTPHIYPIPRHPTRHDQSDIIPLSPTSASKALSPRAPLDRMVSRTPLLSPRPPSPPDTDTPPSHYQPSPLTGATPIRLPPALHANFLTSCIGFATLLMLWPPIILLHWLGWEVFRWPAGEGVTSGTVWMGLGVVSWSGAFYNAGLMILIGIWGPTTSSVANLLTIGLVAVIDAVLMGLLPSIQTLVGVGMICIGFGILLWEGEG